MTSLYRSLTARANPTISLNDLLQSFQFGGLNYALQQGGTPGQDGEQVEANFRGYIDGALKSNGIVFACMLVRLLLFSEARFQFQQMVKGRPGDLYGTQDLAILETPWTGATTGDLLSRAIQDVDLAGNFYAVRRGNTIRRLRPDWVTIILGSRTGQEIDTEIVGYAYDQGGPASGEDVILLQPEQVCHFAPIPDPNAKFRGMSWLTPIVEEIVGDRAATIHKRNFFENGTKLGHVVTLGEDVVNPDQFQKWVEKFKAGHEGALNAYKTLFLAAGADVKIVGTDLKQVDFKQVQGAGETRIAAAAGVPPIIVGLSEGLEAATYSNYGQARRRFADGTMRPLWRNMAGSLARIITVPGGSRLWYDARDISFLQEDVKDEADIQFVQAQAIRQLVDAGFDADSVVKAVTAGDLTRLDHSGLFSVQLQPAGSQVGSGSSQNGDQPALPAGNGPP